MIWHSYHQPQIKAAESIADQAERKAERAANDLGTLERHVDRIGLACQAMWELLREHSGITEEDLERKILEVDLRDGKLDGRIGHTIMECPQCGKNTNSKRFNCVMCGAPIERAHKFEG